VLNPALYRNLSGLRIENFKSQGVAAVNADNDVIAVSVSHEKVVTIALVLVQHMLEGEHVHRIAHGI
jgi:hypothetical protein